MLIRITNTEGLSALVDNADQRNGEVFIQGDPPLAGHLHDLLNRFLTPHRGLARHIDERYLIRTRDGYPDELYKASDAYLQEHFIRTECPLFGYRAEIIEE